jgi:hypothetical protein
MDNIKDFETMKSQYGTAFAVTVFHKELKDQFWQSLSVNDWLAIYLHTLTSEELELNILEKMEIFLNGFDKWRMILKKAPQGSNLQKTALKNVAALAGNNYYLWTEIGR